MAKVLCIYEIRPDSAEVKPESIEERIRMSVPDGMVMADSTEKIPIAFGLMALKAQFVFEEKDGIQDALEDYLNQVEGVGNVVLSYITRL